MSAKGMLIVISAPSGCGKGTILSQILKSEDYYYSVSATTRAPRENEIDGSDYCFMSEDEFRGHIESGEMLEYSIYCGNYYGTPKKAVEKKLAEGKKVILEIEVEGAMQIRRIRNDAIFIFIKPPSLDALRKRLEKRGTENAESISKRIKEAEKEMKYALEYDYIIENSDVNKAVNDFKAIIRAECLKPHFLND